MWYRCILCGDDTSNNLILLAAHVRRHGKEAKQAYKRGYWKVKMSEPNLFDAVDSSITKAIEIAPQIDIGEHSKAKAADEGDTKATESLAGAGADVSPSIVKVVGEIEVPYFIEPNADLIVGATGSGKTVNVGRVSDYVLAKYGKLSRLASMDNVGSISGKIKAGQIEHWPMAIWRNHVDIIRKACQGYWPLRPTDPDSPIVPPDAGTYEVYGFMAYEGLTSFGDAILNSLGDDQAKLSQSPSYVWSQGDSTFSGGNESYYGFMQKELNRFVMYSNMLPFERILWTALEAKGDDQGAKVYGPMIGGKKATAKAGAWFCNFFHMDILTGEKIKDAGTGQELVKARHVLFLKTHIDPLTMIPFPSKVRPPVEFASRVPDYLESGSVSDAYKLLDGLYEEQEKDSTKKMSEIAGLRDRLLERAQKARLAESEAAEKRAKAAKLLKPMVSVPSTVVNTTKVPVSTRTNGEAQPITAPKGIVGASQPPTMPTMPKKPVGAVSIQPAGKVK